MNHKLITLNSLSQVFLWPLPWWACCMLTGQLQIPNMISKICCFSMTSAEIYQNGAIQLEIGLSIKSNYTVTVIPILVGGFMRAILPGRIMNFRLRCSFIQMLRLFFEAPGIIRMNMSWIYTNHLLDQEWATHMPYLKYQDGIMTNLSGGYIHTPVPLTDPIVVKVQISGNYLILYINDDYVIEIYDPDPLPDGRIGLGGDSDFRAWFDDVSVTMLPPIMFLPTHQEKYGSPGDEITYTINLENHTGITDSFDLEVLPDYQWNTTLSTNTVGPIADGERISFNAQVDLTPGALPGDFDTAVIQATSVTSPTVYTQTATITTTAISRNTGYVSLPIENRLEVIDTEIHKAIGFLDMDAYGCGNVSQGRLTPDKSHLYINCGSSKIIVIETAHNSLVTSIDLPSEANDIVFTPDGAYAVVSSPAGQVFVIDTDSYEIIKTIATVSVVSIASHPYLPRIYLGGNDIHNACKIQVIDTNSFSVITTIPFQWELYDLQPSPDGRWLYVTAMNYNPAQPSIYKLDAANVNHHSEALGSRVPFYDTDHT